MTDFSYDKCHKTICHAKAKKDYKFLNQQETRNSDPVKMLNIVAVVVLSVSLILHIVGIAIPYWEYESNFDNGSSSFYRGLWKSCSKSPYFAEVCVAFDLGKL